MWLKNWPVLDSPPSSTHFCVMEILATRLLDLCQVLFTKWYEKMSATMGPQLLCLMWFKGCGFPHWPAFLSQLQIAGPRVPGMECWVLIWFPATSS